MALRLVYCLVQYWPAECQAGGAILRWPVRLARRPLSESEEMSNQ